jgi:hypothetical protein
MALSASLSCMRSEPPPHPSDGTPAAHPDTASNTANNMVVAGQHAAVALAPRQESVPDVARPEAHPRAIHAGHAFERKHRVNRDGIASSGAAVTRRRQETGATCTTYRVCKLYAGWSGGHSWGMRANSREATPRRKQAAEDARLL